jgi:hypothetical protein
MVRALIFRGCQLHLTFSCPSFISILFARATRKFGMLLSHPTARRWAARGGLQKVEVSPCCVYYSTSRRAMTWIGSNKSQTSIRENVEVEACGSWGGEVKIFTLSHLRKSKPLSWNCFPCCLLLAIKALQYLVYSILSRMLWSFNIYFCSISQGLNLEVPSGLGWTFREMKIRIFAWDWFLNRRFR